MPMSGDPRIPGQAGHDPFPEGDHALGQRPGERHPGQQVEGVLLGQLGEQAADLLERSRPPGAPVGVDPEVDAGGGDGRVGDPVGDRGLDGDVLEVGRAGVEQERLLPVVDRHLAQCGRERPEPEGLAGAVVGQLAVAEVPDVGGGVGP